MPTTFEKERQLQDEITPQVERDLPGVDVLAVELLTPSRFCVYVDHPEGVDHALCERVTRELDEYRREYAIEVSSPGLERPLRKPAHFRNAVGRRVAVRTSEEIGGRKRFKGTVAAADKEALALGVEGGERVEIPYAAIVRGNLIEEVGAR